MKKLEISQMESLQGGKMTWRECMTWATSQPESWFLGLAAGLTGGGAVVGMAIGYSAACAYIAS